MCTVTYIPKGNGDFILTSNRDEQARRSPKNISKNVRAGQTLAFPQDTLAGGSWIAASSLNRTACLLNGAFGLHIRKPAYRRSRGLMLLDFFEFDGALPFCRDYLFTGMEPFTMVILDQGTLYELRWDENRLYLQELDPECPRIWSSTTLYDQAVRAKRERWFEAWLKERNIFSLESILDFHRHAGDGDAWNDVVMNRNGMVQTVSITSIVKDGMQVAIRYEDLLNEQSTQEKIALKGEVVGLRQA